MARTHMLEAIERCAAGSHEAHRRGEQDGWPTVLKCVRFAKASFSSDLPDPMQLVLELEDAHEQIRELQDALERALVKVTLAEKEVTHFESALRWRAAADKANMANRASQIKQRTWPKILPIRIGNKPTPQAAADTLSGQNASSPALSPGAGADWTSTQEQDALDIMSGRTGGEKKQTLHAHEGHHLGG